MSSGRRPRSRRGGRTWVFSVLWVALGIVAILGAVAVVATLHALRLERRLNTVPAILQQAETAAERGQLATAQRDLSQAQASLGSANSALYNSPDFALMHAIPIARQNLDALRRSTTLALQLVGGGEDILRAASPLRVGDGRLSVPLRGGEVPLSATEAIQTAITNFITDLPVSANPPSGHFLLGRVRQAERRVYSEAARRRAEFTSVASAIRILDDIAGANGDRRYLIAVANSAEMRGSGGMILSYGVLTSHRGKVVLAHFGGIDELRLHQAETAAAFPSDFMRQYAVLGPTLNWRNANIMSDFTLDAPVLEAMFHQATGMHVDGVIQVDPVGLGAVLAGVGPVNTPDLGSVTSANVVRLTLSEAYQLFPNRQLRQDYTGEVADAAFARLLSGDFTALRPLGVALLHSGTDRHVLMYSNDATDETAIRTLRFDGGLPPANAAFAQLAVENFGGNKLDYYLRSSLTLGGEAPSQTGSHVTATVILSNGAPRGQSQPVEVFGPFNPGSPPGEYAGLVTLYLPSRSYLISSQTDGTASTQPTQASQNGLCAISFTVSIPAGRSSRTVLHLFLPPTSSRSFAFVPTPRVLATRYIEKYR